MNKWTWIANMLSTQPSLSLCRTKNIDDGDFWPYAHVYQLDDKTWQAIWDDGSPIDRFKHKGEAVDNAFDAVQNDINVLLDS
jgi:hypothetical protein